MAGRSVSLVIDGDPLELSLNARLHPMARARLTADWKKRTYNCWSRAGRVRLSPPVLIQYTIRRKRAVDRDNAAASTKAITDALTDRGSPYGRAMLPDDNAQMVYYAPIILETGREWAKNPQVVLTAREMQEEELGIHYRAPRPEDAHPAPGELAPPPEGAAHRPRSRHR